MSEPNLDARTVDGFGDEWSRFDQTQLSATEQRALFDAYFAQMPWSELSPDAVGFDAGCGSGRWAELVAPRVGTLHCVDASRDALAVARRKLGASGNCVFHESSIERLPVADASMDFGYSLGVLHHVPDTAAGLHACTRKLRPGAPFVLYLYYDFDNRPEWFRRVWQVSDWGRSAISRLPHPARYAVSQAIALAVYYPLARASHLLERVGLDVANIPLSSYRDRSFYVMRTDALDRFGTRLEKRFTRAEIEKLMQDAGLEDLRFNEHPPYWCAVGRKGRS